MNYLLVDTCVLADIMKQYNPAAPHTLFSEGANLKKNMLKMVNTIVSDENGDNGYIITSTFAYLELINKFNEIFKDVDNESMFRRVIATIQQPPSWLIIEDMDMETAKHFCEVPNSIKSGVHISSDDAVHIATALQRGDDIHLLTTDHVLKEVEIEKISVVTD